ncbi:MAG: polyphosphate polymerase domain-containing protein [Clostridia bacterium]|nr:polyphosphate polymerase domain-containing protein [Clostridiales bacterium]MDO4352017.1 polyphosphate polymerase domain-containing protein [Clostridia bacterium]MEE0180257.1 polyphosphate polymerase domain-containing protein [Anaerovoracaceae bacterium]
MNEVYRKEKKFLISLDEYIKKRHMLSQVLKPDAHSAADGYMIRTLYFDTVFDEDFDDKLAGIETRRKIRLRIYDTESDFAMLEMKQKQGDSQLKRSLRVSKADAVRLSGGDYSPLLGYGDVFAAECYGLMNYKCYRPKTIVQYNRYAFVAKENKTRITFDSNIEATESCFDLFSDRLDMNPVMDRYNVILEVKYNGFLLEYIRRMINSINRSEISASKYVLARQTGYKTRL